MSSPPVAEKCRFLMRTGSECALYLAEHAGFMTGQNLTLDGGMTVKMIYQA